MSDLANYEYFTDIEFNPNKSINCQAKAVAILRAMLKQYNGIIPDIENNLEKFKKFYYSIGADKV